MPRTDDQVISHTIAWIKKVVIGCNFCPFASKAMMKNSIRYTVVQEATRASALATLAEELQFLDDHQETETTLVIFPDQLEDFESYLDLVELAEKLLVMQGYEGIYQIASFHPEYVFADSYEADPANYTNRSVYPMLHLLRESSITEAVAHYPDAEGIPQRNIEFTKQKGWRFMQQLRASCMAK
jgi:hypothetical protein